VRRAEATHMLAFFLLWRFVKEGEATDFASVCGCTYNG
jgi:hypothetical protein